MVDLQERLAPAVHDADRMVANSAWLIQIAQRLEVPVLASEQYPKGLGPTVAAIRELLPAEAFMEKMHFSCAAERDRMRRIDVSGRKKNKLSSWAPKPVRPRVANRVGFARRRQGCLLGRRRGFLPELAARCGTGAGADARRRRARGQP